MSRITDQLRHYGIQPKRSLGQNFLVDDAYLDHIVAAAELSAADTVLEIGPGMGVLTAELARRADRVVSVELDDRLIGLLQERFADQGHITIVHGDILELDPVALLRSDETDGASAGEGLAYKVVANLPYYITSAVLRHLLEQKQPPEVAIVMVQKEVAERICAAPGDLSLLAIGVQFYARPTIVQGVPAGAFYPRPKVDSAILRLDVFPEPAVTDVAPRRFFAVVRAGFSQKRKQLINSLSAGLALAKVDVRAIMERAEIDPRRRPETLSLSEWRAICLAYEQDGLG